MSTKNRFTSAALLRFRRRTVVYAVAVLAAVTLLAPAAYSAMVDVIAVGTIPQSAIFEGPATVTARTLTIKPNETLAWHYHPGYAFNAVKSGNLTVEEGCGGVETLTSGQAFEEIDGHVHRAMNLSPTEDAVVSNTFIVPQGRPTTVNIPGNERRCGPPAEVSECKDGGWAKFDFPAPFENEGDCVQFVRHRPRVTLNVPLDPLK
jgi:quercetin dioxygenase-like cupin family protein